MMYSLVRPLLFRMDAERAHGLAASALGVAALPPGGLALLRAAFARQDPALATECAGLRFANPLGLAAGFDKRAVLVRPMGAIGFGHVEVGTVTPRPQPGNDRPRMFRLVEDEALINRLGFNSPGMVEVARRLRAPRPPGGPVVGVNIGKNRDTPLERAPEDYLAAFVALAPLADYVAVNISSPNTPGLRQLHDRRALAELLGALAGANRALERPRPIFLKVSPDESDAQLSEVVGAGLEAGVAGFIATNTTLAREGLRGARAGEAGGLSGRPLAGRALAALRLIAGLARGRAELIAVGGVADAADAYARIRAGAALVQIYSAMVYRGPGLPGQICAGLAELLRRDGFATAREAVGADLR